VSASKKYIKHTEINNPVARNPKIKFSIIVSGIYDEGYVGPVKEFINKTSVAEIDSDVKHTSVRRCSKIYNSYFNRYFRTTIINLLSDGQGFTVIYWWAASIDKS
jgi:hypothetical protein